MGDTPNGWFIMENEIKTDDVGHFGVPTTISSTVSSTTLPDCASMRR